MVQRCSIGSVGSRFWLVIAFGLAGPAWAQCEPAWDTRLGGVGGELEGVTAITAWDDGGGQRVYVGGGFNGIGGIEAASLASVDPETGGWTAVPGLESIWGEVLVWSMVPFDPGDGRGERLVVAGSFTSAGGLPGTANLAMWNGESWEALHTGWLTAEEYGWLTLTVWNERLYIAGRPGFEVFQIGGVEWAGMASWDGMRWESHVGFAAGVIMTLAVFDDGSGEALYAGGRFGYIDFIPGTKLVARFDGASWSSVGGGLATSTTAVRDMIVHDDGSGPALYATGSHMWTLEHGSGNIVRWDGEAWRPAGPRRVGHEHGAIVAFDDGSGVDLYLGGWGLSAAYPAVRSGGAWAPVGGGTEEGASVLEVIDGDLWVGGRFREIGGMPAGGLAIWTGCPPCYADCDGSGELDFFDFLCFQNAFAAGELYADCDDSGALEFFDFLCFQNEFAAGCP